MTSAALPRALLFDLDGTLIDSDPLHARVFVEMLAELGVEVDEAFYLRRIHGRRNVETFAELVPEADPVRLDREKEERFRALLGAQVEPTPGLGALLAVAAARELPVALVTNACRPNVDAMLAALGFSGRFAVEVLGDEMPRGKPFPDPYLAAASALGIPPQECLAFEDSPAGIRAAVAAGIPVVGIRSSLGEEALLEAGAALTIADFTDPGLARVIPFVTGVAA